MRSFLTFLGVLFSLTTSSANRNTEQTISGEQPNAAIDTKGVLRVAFGRGDRIYCMSSTDKGNTFSKPVLVGEVSGMQLGHTRGHK